MSTLKDILEKKSLKDFDEELSRGIEEMKQHPNEMKRCLMLCIMAEKALSELAKTDVSNYVGKLQEQVENLKAEHEKNINILKMHSNENILICDQFDSYPKELETIKCKVEEWIVEYDRILGEVIKVRDNMSVFDAKKKQNGLA